jgi:hypothetical protein
LRGIGVRQHNRLSGKQRRQNGTEYTNRCRRAAKSLQSLLTNNPTGEPGHNPGHKHEPATHRGTRRIKRGSNQPAKYRGRNSTMRSSPNSTHEVRHRRMPCQGFGGLRILYGFLRPSWRSSKAATLPEGRHFFSLAWLAAYLAVFVSPDDGQRFCDKHVVAVGYGP